MTLYQLRILGTCLGIIGIASLVYLICLNWKLCREMLPWNHDKYEVVKIKTGKKPSVTKMDDVIAKRQNSIKSWTIITAVFLLVTMLVLSFYGVMSGLAIKKGVYGDTWEKTETISTVWTHARHGFSDQSDDLPDDTSGCLVIMFKYGCIDCTDTHDQIVQTIKDNAKFPDKIYAVSSRSETGQKLVNDYDVIGVPYGIYFHKDSTYTGLVLYDAFEKDDPSAKYIEENMLELIELQNGGT